MDWRNRKYYIARFSLESYDMRVQLFKNIPGVRLHNPAKYHDAKLPDEKEARGYYQFLIGCRDDISDLVEYELRKAKRRDMYSWWKEIERDII